MRLVADVVDVATLWSLLNSKKMNNVFTIFRVCLRQENVNSMSSLFGEKAEKAEKLQTIAGIDVSLI
jgi:hypothetical protein